MSDVSVHKLLLLNALLLLYCTRESNSQTTIGNTILPITDVPPCTALSDTASFCTNTGYYENILTYLPNARGHETPMEAVAELINFLPIVNSDCSNAVSFFLCSYYVPACFQLGNNYIQFKPCRNLCEYVQSRCESDLIANGYPWPAHFNCSLSDFADLPQCFGPSNPSELDNIFTTTLTVPTNATTASMDTSTASMDTSTSSIDTSTASTGVTDVMLTTSGESQVSVSLTLVITVITIINFVN